MLTHRNENYLLGQLRPTLFNAIISIKAIKLFQQYGGRKKINIAASKWTIDKRMYRK